MKILWLYKYIKEYDFDHNLHMSLAKFISAYPGVNLKAYGPGLHLGYPKIAPVQYDRRITMSDLVKAFNFDVVIICTKSRCFDNYNPHKGIAEDCWLPRDFKFYNIPKIVLEEDYHYEKNDDWYKEVGINLILQRHYSQSLRQNFVPMIFHPFSVDVATFNSWKTECTHAGTVLSLPLSRMKRFCFVGNDADKAYIYRRTAKNILFDKGMCANFTGSIKVDGDYVKVLREYVAYISCGSTYEICAAKNFEIMASGGLLFTNEFKGIDLLFNKDCYLSYKNDGSDVLELAKNILNDSDRLVSIVKNARQCIYNRHTHDIRLEELLKIIRTMK